MRIALALAFVAVPVVVSAQVPLGPGKFTSFEIDPGTRVAATGTGTEARPEANVIYEYKIDGATTPVPAVKSAACTPATSGVGLLTCRLVAPTLAAGVHTIQVRGVVSPAEPDVAPGPWSSPLSVVVLIVAPPGLPANIRLTPAVP